ncbi:MAG: HD-GYP domain-containing protein [Candidatus Eremiobacteraeota bacterium]|nr:HD-GYP domain-containing protein [Candidatus Eremiobacteraeota bacterium]
MKGTAVTAARDLKEAPQQAPVSLQPLLEQAKNAASQGSHMEALEFLPGAGKGQTLFSESLESPGQFASGVQYESPHEKTLLAMQRTFHQQALSSSSLFPPLMASEVPFEFLPASQNSLLDSLKLIWKSYLSATGSEGTLPQAQYQLQTEQGPQYSGLKMDEKGVPQGPPQAPSSSLSREAAKVPYKGERYTPQQEDDDRLPWLMDSKKMQERSSTAQSQETDDDSQQGDKKDQDGGKGGKREGKNRDGGKEHSRDEEQKKPYEEADADEEIEADRILEADEHMEIDKAGEIAAPSLVAPQAVTRQQEITGYPSSSLFKEGYFPMWDFQGASFSMKPAARTFNHIAVTAFFSSYGSAGRYLRFSRQGSRQMLESEGFETLQAAVLPLFAQIYAESTTPMGKNQAPPAMPYVPLNVLRKNIIMYMELSIFMPLRMALRASRYVASVIEDIIKRRHQPKDLTKEYFATYLATMMRISGDFTLSHSLRTMELALDLAGSTGIQDEETMEQIRLGSFYKDIGEMDFLLSRLPAKNREGIASFFESKDLRWAGALHDIGKIRIPREILYKPGALTDEEFKIMKLHPIYSENILYPVTSLRFLCPVVRAHHERWDGKGYPDGISGRKIPVASRIIAISDVFDALISDRPYKKGMPWEKVRKILEEGRGTHFDPYLLDAFLALVTPRYEKAREE